MRHLVIVGLLLAGCAAKPPPAQALADACLTAARALNVATAADKAGKLTDVAVRRITIAGTAVNAVCSQATPPTDLTGALTVVYQATVDLVALARGE